jgi:transcriptional regulator with XRE-family HTH domain
MESQRSDSVKQQANREVGRFLTLLRDKMRKQGYTQLEVQEHLGWGRSYISQLVTDQKGLRVDQLLCILFVIGVEPGEFFQELYPSEDYLRSLSWFGRKTEGEAP